MQLGGGDGEACFAAFAAVTSFGAHPLRVEVAAWASAQPYSLAGAFAAAALLAHITALPKDVKGSGRWRAAALACYALASFSKSAAVPLAAAHLALEATYGVASAADSARMLFGVAVIAVAAAAGAFYGNCSHVDVIPPTHNGGAGLWPRQRIAAAAVAVFDGAARALTLRGIAVRYDLPPEVSPLDARHFSASLPLLALAFAGLAALTRQLPAWRRVLRGLPGAVPPAPAALPSCLALALLALFPSSGVLRHGYDNAGADRYSYFAAMLLVPAVSAAVKAAVQAARPAAWLRRAVMAAVTLALLAAAYKSARGCEAWRDPVSFGWAELAAARTAEAQAAAANDLGLRLHGAGRHAEALDLLTGPFGLGGAAPTHLSMALTASASAASVAQHERGLRALAPALRAHGHREGALHINAAVLAAGACRAAEARKHMRAAAALSTASAAGSSLERRVDAVLSRCSFKSVAITWPVGAATGWGTLSRALLRALLRANATPMLLHEPTATRHMLEAFSASELQGLHAAHVNLLKMVGQSVTMGDGLDPVACSVLELPMPVLHGLGNGLRGSDVVQSGGVNGCLRLSGLANAGLVFFEDMRDGFNDAAWTASRLSHFTALVAGSSWTRGVLLAVPRRPAVHLARQGVEAAVFPARRAQPALTGEFRVFSGGKLEHRKGQDVVVAAFRRFVATHPEAVLIAAWHTDYPELAQGLAAPGHVTAPPLELTELRMLQWLDANGVPESAVRLLGAVDSATVSRALADSHVAVFPSRAESGTNLFAVQALAGSVPSVLSGGTGHADLDEVFDCDGARDDVERLCYVMTQGVGVGQDARRGWTEPSVEEAVELLERAFAAAKRGLSDAALADAARRGAESMSWERWYANASAAWV